MVIVDAFETRALVELESANGATLDVLSVPYSALTIDQEASEREHVH